jgi:hypothetical protein
MAKLAGIIVVFLIVLLLPLTAKADGSGACTFTGIVTSGDAVVADGTVITAIIEGDKYNTHTSTVLGYSAYSLTISAPEGKTYADGTEIIFMVNDRDTGQVATFESGTTIVLDLSASSASGIPTTTVAAAGGATFLVLILAAAVYYVLSRRRGVRVADQSQVGDVAPPGQALAASAEGGQILNRYIWDSTRLEWVENPALGDQQPQTRKAAVQERPAAATEKENVTSKTVDVLYEGKVKLLVISPVGLVQLRRFSTNLNQISRILLIKARVVNSLSRQSLSFELFLPKPMPLVKILMALPEVDTVYYVARRNLVEVRLNR